MPKIEVEEADYASGTALAARFAKVLSNPEIRGDFLRLWKKGNPDIAIPEVDARAPVDSALEEIRKELAADRKAREEEKTARETEKATNDFATKWAKQKQAVRESYPDLNDAGLEAVEKLATERGIPDLEAAAALFRRLNPPAEPTAPNGGVGGWNFFEQPQEEVKDFMAAQMKAEGQSTGLLDQQIRNVLADVRGQRRAA